MIVLPQKPHHSGWHAFSKRTFSQDIKSLQLPTAKCWFSCIFYWHEIVDKDLDLDQLKRGLYLDMTRCSANGENLDVMRFNRHIHMQLWASFVFNDLHLLHCHWHRQWCSIGVWIIEDSEDMKCNTLITTLKFSNF